MESDLLSRLEQFAEFGGGLGILVLGMLVVACMFLVVFGRRDLLLAGFLFSLAFSGNVIPFLDSGSTLMRWGLMVMLAFTGLYRGRWPGWPAVLLGLCIFMGLLMGLGHPFVSFIVQKSVLMLVLALPMAIAIAYQMDSKERILRIVRWFPLAAALVAVLGLISLPTLRAGMRFAGTTSGAPLFVMTGGMFLPFALWGAMQPRGRVWRVFCALVFVSISLVNVLSGQRAGTVAGFLGCVPILTGLKPKRLLAVAMVLLAGIAAVYIALTMMPEQARYIHERYFAQGTSGRSELWMRGLNMCLVFPFIGKGTGAATFISSGFHNAYLAVWYDCGIFGLLLFLAAYLLTGFMGLRLIIGARDRETKEIGRLVVGSILACMFMAMFEESVWSPSNVAATFTVITGVVASRMLSLRRQGQLDSEYSTLDVGYDPIRYPVLSGEDPSSMPSG